MRCRKGYTLRTSNNSPGYFLVLFLGLYLIFPVFGDDRIEEEAAEKYCRTLSALNAERKTLIEGMEKLVLANQALRAQILAAEKLAIDRARLASALPDFSVSIETIYESTSPRAERGKIRYEPRLNDFSSAKEGVGAESALWAMLSQSGRNQALQQGVLFRGEMDKLRNNLLQFCRAADLYGERGELESRNGVRLASEWIDKDPSHLGARVVRSSLLRNLGDFEEAKKDAWYACSIVSPCFPFAATLGAQCEYLAGNDLVATKTLRYLSLQFKKDHEFPLIVSAMIRGCQGDSEKALLEAKSAAVHNERSSYAHSVLGLLESFNDGSSQKNLAGFEQASIGAKLGTDSTWLSHEVFAWVQWKNDRIDGATKSFQKAKEMAFGSQKERISNQIERLQMGDSCNFGWKEYLVSAWAANAAR